MSERAGASVHDDSALIRRLAAERDALQAKVTLFKQRERDRKERAEQRRASRTFASTLEPPVVKSLDIDFERPPMVPQEISQMVASRTHEITDPAEMYLDLLKNILTRVPFGERDSIDPRTCRMKAFDVITRFNGADFWPSEAETMAGLLRLDNVQQCVVEVLRNRIPGDLVETGVWRGGITILMRAILKAFGDTKRTVWAADSFAGLPAPNANQYEADAGMNFSTAAGYDILAVSVEEVQANFARYGLLDDRVRFLVGWFRDTLPTAPIEQISVLRLDGDLYESTMDALDALYPKLSVGGYLIVDDYLSWEPCQKAVNEYRSAHDITEPIEGIDWTGAYWRRER